MRKFFQKGLALVLLMVVFISTTGLNVFTHLCSNSGDSEVSMLQLENCCSTAGIGDQTSSVEDDCCSTNHLLFRLDIPAYQPESNIYAGHFTWVNLPVVDYAIPQGENDYSLTAVRPPPDLGITGRSISISVQSFLI